MINKSQQDIIKALLLPYGPKEVAIFGSYARGENKPGSDLDILIDLEKRISLLDLVGLEQALTDKLGIKVDLVTRRALSFRIEKLIEKDLIKIS